MERIKKHITSILALGVISWIFGTDTILLIEGKQTYSEEITRWIQVDWKHLAIYLILVFLISVHWIFGYYNNK